MDEYMALFYETYHFYPEHYLSPPPPEDIDYRGWKAGNYPDNFYKPSNQWEKGCDGTTFQNYRYTPYKRISHFREHLNRLQGCQFVTIPDKVYDLTRTLLNKEFNNETYFSMKKLLRKHHFSQYNEHIHHLVGYQTKEYINISYEDHALMCQLFIQLEYQFKQRQSIDFSSRKNIFSYYLIVQLILYVFHYHSAYALPTLYDGTKRQRYYLFLLEILQSTPLGSFIMEQHFIKKRQCQYCRTGSKLFDHDLIIHL